MSIFDPYVLLISIYIIVCLLAIYADYFLLKKKRLIWPSLQEDMRHYRDVEAVLKSRIFVGIIILCFLLNIIYDYVFYRDIVIDKFFWSLIIAFSLSAINNGVVSYKSDTRGKWSKVYRHFILLLLILIWGFRKYLF